MRRVVAAVALVAMAAPPAAGAAMPTQPVVGLLRDHVARVAPSFTARHVARVRARRPLTGVRTVLPELDRSGIWVKVALPGRPNGATGWIQQAGSRANATPWQLVVSLRRRQVTVTYFGRVARRFAAIVGAPATPTPRGRFFVEEALALRPRAPGGPFALAMSARSAVLQEFRGGPGQIAIHGRNRLPGALGTASSHGCIRLRAGAITWLARRVGAGVPVVVTR